MKLNVDILRYLSPDAFRVLTAVELGMRNHELVPTELVESLASLRRGGAFKQIQLLHKHKLVFHDSRTYDGYRLTSLGYDYLAIKAMVNRGTIAGIGRQIGVGKESDIYEIADNNGDTLVLKIHRLGRTSFRKVKSKRDYLKHRKNASWLYFSRLSAQKEFAFMKVLHERDFPVPTPIDVNRHCIVMSHIPGYPLEQVKQLHNPANVYEQLMELILQLANHGLIHCDYNEFNLMIGDDEEITLIDFPQMVSVDHPDAEVYFNRDVECIRTYFSKRFHFDSAEFPTLNEDIELLERLDVVAEASGFGKNEEETLEAKDKESTEAVDQHVTLLKQELEQLEKKAEALFQKEQYTQAATLQQQIKAIQQEIQAVNETLGLNDSSEDEDSSSGEEKEPTKDSKHSTGTPKNSRDITPPSEVGSDDKLGHRQEALFKVEKARIRRKIRGAERRRKQKVSKKRSTKNSLVSNAKHDMNSGW